MQENQKFTKLELRILVAVSGTVLLLCVAIAEKFATPLLYLPGIGLLAILINDDDTDAFNKGNWRHFV